MFFVDLIFNEINTDLFHFKMNCLSLIIIIELFNNTKYKSILTFFYSLFYFRIRLDKSLIMVE